MRIFNYSTLKDEQWDSEILGLVAQIHEFKGRQELFVSCEDGCLIIPQKWYTKIQDYQEGEFTQQR